MAYKTIDGVKYEKELLDLATEHTTGKGEGKLSKDEVAELFKSASDGNGVTETEKVTLQYIRQNYEFTDAAAKDFDEAFAKLATEEKAEVKPNSAKSSEGSKAESLKEKADEAKRLYLSELAKKSGGIQKEQFNATTDQIIEALNTLGDQIDIARAKGSIRAKDIVEGFGGDGKLNELVTDLAGYMGEMTGAGTTIATTPLVIMAGAAKGVYKKITD